MVSSAVVEVVADAVPTSCPDLSVVAAALTFDLCASYSHDEALLLQLHGMTHYVDDRRKRSSLAVVQAECTDHAMHSYAMA